MINNIEKIYYIIYNLARKGNNEFESACIASLIFSIGMTLFFMDIDALFAIIFNKSFLLLTKTNWNIIILSGSLTVLFFSLFAFSGNYKHIVKKNMEMSAVETRKINRISILYFSIAFSLFIVLVVIYNMIK